MVHAYSFFGSTADFVIKKGTFGIFPDSAISKRQVSLLAHFPWLCFSSDPHYTFSLPCTHFYFSLSPNFFSGSVIGVFFFILVTLDLCLVLIHRDL
jgi:hypothetical protein